MDITDWACKADRYCAVRAVLKLALVCYGHEGYFAGDFNDYRLVGWETHFFFMQSESRIEDISRAVIAEGGYELIEMIMRGEKRTRVLELFVDRKAFVNIDDLAEMSRRLEERIGTELPETDLSRIVMSSPGTERPFRHVWQLDKHIGRTLSAEMNDGTHHEGIIENVDDETGVITLLVPGEKKKSGPVEVFLNFRDIRESRIKISFSKK